MSTLSQMGIPGVGTGHLQPKQQHKWRVTFQNIGGGAQSADLSMQAVSVTRPNLTFEEIPIHRYNSTSYVGGKNVWEPCSLTIEDDITNRASGVIQEQLELQQKLIGADGPWMASASSASAYKFGLRLELLDGDELVLETWQLEGCWLLSVDWTEMNYSASDAVTINTSIRFDHARQTLANNTSLGTAIGGTA